MCWSCAPVDQETPGQTETHKGSGNGWLCPILHSLPGCRHTLPCWITALTASTLRESLTQCEHWHLPCAEYKGFFSSFIECYFWGDYIQVLQIICSVEVSMGHSTEGHSIYWIVKALQELLDSIRLKCTLMPCRWIWCLSDVLCF